jgi:hypothetical protein
MAWQGGNASMPQITAKAALKPAGRNLALEAVQQRLRPNRALTGILGCLVPLFKLRITADWPSPRFPKVG